MMISDGCPRDCTIASPMPVDMFAVVQKIKNGWALAEYDEAE